MTAAKPLRKLESRMVIPREKMYERMGSVGATTGRQRVPSQALNRFA
jgi:hypothetical protein